MAILQFIEGLIGLALFLFFWLVFIYLTFFVAGYGWYLGRKYAEKAP